MTDLISRATRNAFREHLVGWTLREITTVFSNEDFRPSPDTPPGVGGERRTLVEQFHNAIDFTNPREVARVVRVYAEICEVLERKATITPGESMLAHEAEQLNVLLSKMKRDGWKWADRQFVRIEDRPVSLHIRALELSEASVREHVDKARDKIARGDHAGAITNAYTLVESLLKALLKELVPSVKETQGDIRALFAALKGPMNLDAGDAAIETTLKPILTGLQSQISGLFELANKASDRHARRYNPAPHHAKLAVNCAFTLCEFLLESYEHQKALANRKKAS